MLENVKTQIANSLGSDFLIFWNTAHEDINLAKKNENKVVGVAFENFGTYSAIENSVAYDGNLIIDFCIPSENESIYNGYVAKINEVIQSKNAQFEVVSFDENGSGKQVINYVLVFDGLRASGSEDISYNVVRQSLTLSIKVSASPDIAFGNKTTIEIQNNVKEWLPLENCLTIDFVGQQQTIQKVVTSSFEAGNVPQYEISRIVATYMYKHESELHEIIQHRYMAGIDAVYNVRLKLNYDVLKLTAVCASYLHNNPTGGFQTIQVEFVRADLSDELPNYELTIGNVQNGTLEVYRGGFKMYNGDIVVPGDELFIVATPNSGYILKRLQAQSVNVPNGGIYIVSANTTVTAEFIEGIVQNWVVKLKQGEGTVLTVKNGDTVVSNDTIVDDNTVLTITATEKVGFDVSKISVNGDTLSGSSYTVRSDVEIESFGELESRKIDAFINVPSGQAKRDIVIKGYKIRDYYNAEFNELVIDTSTNDYTYTGKYKDVLKLENSIASSSALQVKAFKFNGMTVQNNYEATLTEDGNAVVCDAEYKAFSLRIDITGATWEIKRGEEFLQNGSAIYVGDVLTATFTPYSGYRMPYVDVNDGSVQNGGSFTVDGDTLVYGVSYSSITYRTTEPVAVDTKDYGKTFIIVDGHQWDGEVYKFVYWTTEPVGVGAKYYAGETYVGVDKTLYWWGEQGKTLVKIRVKSTLISSGNYGLQAYARNINESEIAVNTKLTIHGGYDFGGEHYGYDIELLAGESFHNMPLTWSSGVTNVTIESITPTESGTQTYKNAQGQ